MPRNCILIIDDEPDSVRLLRFAFERAGFEVLVCSQAQQALATALSGEPMPCCSPWNWAVTAAKLKGAKIRTA
jgi:CheY-like chemotaxis protein